MQDLQHRLDNSHERCDRYFAVLDCLRTASDDDALKLLSRIRCGETIDQISSSLHARWPMVPHYNTFQPHGDDEGPSAESYGSGVPSGRWEDALDYTMQPRYPYIELEGGGNLDPMLRAPPNGRPFEDVELPRAYQPPGYPWFAN